MKINYPLKHRLNLFGHPANGMLPSVWFSAIYRNGFSTAEFPKVAVISLTVLLNVPFIWFERIWIRQKIRKIQISKPVFIIGHPRSGTTFLHYLLSKDADFVTPRTYQTVLPNTFLFFGKVFRFILNIFLPKQRPMDEMSMGPDEPKEEEFALAATGSSLATAYYFPNNLPQIFRNWVLFGGNPELKKDWQNRLLAFCKKLLLRSPGKRLLLKSPYNLARIDAIREVFPDAQFIHIHRKPEDVYHSNCKLFKQLLPVLSLQRPDSKIIERFLEDSYPLVFNRYFDDAKKLRPENLIELSFDDLRMEPIAALEKIYQQFNLSGFQPKKEEFSAYLKEVEDYRPANYEKSTNDSLMPESWLTVKQKLGYG